MLYTLCLVSAADQPAAAAIDPNLAFDVACCALVTDPLGATPTDYFSNGPFTGAERTAIASEFSGVSSLRMREWNDANTDLGTVLQGQGLQLVEAP